MLMVQLQTPSPLQPERFPVPSSTPPYLFHLCTANLSIVSNLLLPESQSAPSVCSLCCHHSTRQRLWLGWSCPKDRHVVFMLTCHSACHAYLSVTKLHGTWAPGHFPSYSKASHMYSSSRNPWQIRCVSRMRWNHSKWRGWSHSYGMEHAPLQIVVTNQWWSSSMTSQSLQGIQGRCPSVWALSCPEDRTSWFFLDQTMHSLRHPA